MVYYCPCGNSSKKEKIVNSKKKNNNCTIGADDAVTVTYAEVYYLQHRLKLG